MWKKQHAAADRIDHRQGEQIAAPAAVCRWDEWMAVLLHQKGLPTDVNSEREVQVGRAF